MTTGAPTPEEYPTQQCGWIALTNESCPSCNEYKVWKTEAELHLCDNCGHAYRHEGRLTRKEVEMFAYVLQHLTTIRREYELYKEDIKAQAWLRRKVPFLGTAQEYKDYNFLKRLGIK